MKIFWSWQSDTPGNIGRHYVRAAIEEAINELNDELTIEESERDEELQLDHDRKGVPGSPDLAPTILAKIRDSSIFIADVTAVGRGENGRALMNPNVAIELGYALDHVGSEGLLMILNTHFGNRDDLPFDLRHKAGPIIFSLAAESDSSERKRVHRELTQTLKTAIRECYRTRPSIVPDNEIHSGSNPTQYFSDGEILFEGRYFSVEYDPDDPRLYLRIIPKQTMPKLREKEIKDIVYGINIQPLAQAISDGASWATNNYGGMTFSYVRTDDQKYLFTSSQIFLNREIWGLDATLFSPDPFIPIISLEEELESSLKHYIEVGRERLGLRPPLFVEAGATKMKGRLLMINNQPQGSSVRTEIIQTRKTLRSFEEPEIDRVLLAIFEDFFDAAAESRPTNFRGFPRKPAG